MTYDEFRSEMETYRAAVSKEAVMMKESNRALRDLNGLYSRFDEEERIMADRVLTEWVQSENECLRFDAESVIRDFKIASTIPALEKLVERLSKASFPGAPYESDKVRRIIDAIRYRDPV